MDSQGSTGKSLDQVRVSDAEREAIVARLNDATGEGRLTLEEFSERVSGALAARTRGDLDLLMVDLPSGSLARSAPASALAPAPLPAMTASQITPLGSVKRKGRWRLDRDTEIGTVVGSIKLDMRHVEIASPDLTLHVRSVVGSVKVWIPHGVAVEVEGTSVVGSRSVEEDVARVGAPVLRLRVDTVVGSVKIYRV
jgi:hypothetical protein